MPPLVPVDGSRLLEPLGYMPPAEFQQAYHDPSGHCSRHGGSQITSSPENPARFDLFFVVRGECGSEGLWYGHFRLGLALLHDLLEVVRDLGHVDDLEAVFRGEITIVEHRHRCAVVVGGVEDIRATYARHI